VIGADNIEATEFLNNLDSEI
jgi:hypothetical protein